MIISGEVQCRTSDSLLNHGEPWRLRVRISLGVHHDSVTVAARPATESESLIGNQFIYLSRCIQAQNTYIILGLSRYSHQHGGLLTNGEQVSCNVELLTSTIKFSRDIIIAVVESEH